MGTFNYRGLARAEVIGTLFGVSKSAFLASAEYAKRGSSLDADEIILRVWDKVIYDEHIGRLVDCSEHVYPIASSSPGFDVTYTGWVSIIPVSFKAGVGLDLDLKWAWSICDDDLSARIELRPTAVLKAYGQAEINLFIVKAGIELSAAFNTEIRPRGMIKGTECTVGFDVHRLSDPMSASFGSYYRTKKCKFLIFDCKWRAEKRQTWWSWSLPAQDEELFSKEWSIAP